MFGAKYPIIQAPMAGVSTPKLAAAVTNAGGIGSLGLAGKSVKEVRAQIQELMGSCNGPFNINFFSFDQEKLDASSADAWLDHLDPLFAQADTQRPERLKPVYEPFGDEMAEVLLDLRPPIVSFHFGLPPSATVAELRRAGIKLVGTATSLDEAKFMQKSSMDAIVAQGYEAGGHRGTFDPRGLSDKRLGTLELLAQLKGEISAPVVAAGGIMDAQSAKRALQAGASAVQLGTAFIGCPESGASEGYRERLLSAKTTNMHNTVSGRYARGLDNAFVQHALEAPTPVPSFPYAYHAQKVLAAADARFVNEWAGSNVRQARAIPAAELVHEIASQLK